MILKIKKYKFYLFVFILIFIFSFMNSFFVYCSKPANVNGKTNAFEKCSSYFDFSSLMTTLEDIPENPFAKAFE